MKKFEKLSVKEILKVIKDSKSREEILRNLGISNSPKNRSLLQRFISKNEVDVSHLNSRWYTDSIKKNYEFEARCPQCGKIFNSKESRKGKQITCSRKCSNFFFAKKRMTKETREKISISVQKYLLSRNQTGAKSVEKIRPNSQIVAKNCAKCGGVFEAKKNVKYCSRECRLLIRKEEGYRKKISVAQKERVKKGIHVGWKTRNIESYPEKYFKQCLENEKINYEFNFPIAKKALGLDGASCYFLDFYFPNANLNLEIDGKQHDLPERKASDETRDFLLSDFSPD